MTYDPGFLAALTILATSLASYFVFGIRFRLSLAYFSGGWFVIGCAALFSIRASQSPASFYLSAAVGLAVAGTVIIFEGLNQRSSTLQVLQNAVLGFLIFFSVSQITSRYWSPDLRAPMLLAAVATIVLCVGVYVALRRADDSWRTRRHFTDWLLVFYGASLAFEALARMMYQDVNYLAAFLEAHQSHVSEDANYILLAVICPISIIARISEVFDEIHAEQARLMAEDASAKRRVAEQQAIGHLDQARSVSMLSATLAHELNQPLTAIVSNSSLVMRMHDRHPSNVDLFKSLGEDIQRDINRISVLLDQYLGDHLELINDLSSPRASCDVRMALESVIDWLGPQIETAGIRVEIDFDRTVNEVALNEVVLTQVFVNLVRNSIQAMAPFHSKERVIRVRGRHAVSELIINFSDTGPGMSAAKLSDLEHREHSDIGAGLGLGLSISRWIIERQNGRFSLWSDLGEGFHIQLALPSTGRH
jgi:signal transduction histidine kinase